jgi:ribonuclease G
VKKSIYADVGPDEQRVAMVEQGKLVDLHIRRAEDVKKAGNIYVGRIVNVVEGINSCFVDIGSGKNGFLPIPDYSGDIRKGEMVLVQAVKEEVQEKGAKLTGKISVAGRHIVFMPSEPKMGVSKNIQDMNERKRLRDILSSVSPKGGGFVARTSAEGRTQKDILREAKFLIKSWGRIQRLANIAKKSGRPKLVYAESGTVIYTAREYLDEDTAVFLINDKYAHRKLLTFVKKLFPELKDRVRYYDEAVPLFERYKLEKQIDNLKKRKISLECGGYIIIEQTEALTAVDVNTGSFTMGANREETALKVNAEAARAAAAQIILRDLGGIIIIDFIDLEKKKNQYKIYSILKQEMKPDKAKLKIFPMTGLGLIEMTRQRRKESIVNILCSNCPYCGGSGMIFSETTMYIRIKKELLKKGPRIPSRAVNLFLHPRVAEVFDGKGIGNIEKAIRKKIILRRDYKLHHEEFRITS